MVLRACTVRHMKKSNLLLRMFNAQSGVTPTSSVADTAISQTHTHAKHFNEIPGPFRLPLIGSLYLYKLGIYNYAEYHNVLRNLCAKYGPIVREQIGDHTIIHLFDPEDVKTVHSVEGNMPDVPPLQETTKFYRTDKDLSPGLGTSNGEEWYRLRNAVQQMMMRPKEVSYYLPFVDEVVRSFVGKIEKNLDSNGVLSLDFREIVAKWILESSGMICFEKRLGCLDTHTDLADKIIRANKDVFYVTGKLKFSLPLYKYFPTPSWTKFKKAEDFLYGTSKKFIDDTIGEVNELLKTNKGQLNNRFNFLSYLLSRKNLSEKDVHVLTLSLFADGLSTTTPTFMYNIFCLAKNQDKQEKLYQELSVNLPPGDQVMSIDTMNKLQFLKACVKESFRLYSNGTEVSRLIKTDLILGGYKVPAGTHVDMNQFVHLRSPSIFKDPSAYVPERWLRDSPQAATNMSPYLLLPFGHGTRMCAGRRFAEQDIYTGIARLLHKFRIELLNPSDTMEQEYNTLLFPKHPLRLRFIKR